MHFLHEAPPTIHHCLALLMHLIDEVNLYYAFKNLSPSVVTKENSMSGLLGSDGIFHKNEILNKVVVKNMKVRKNPFVFIPEKDLKMMMILTENNVRVGAILLGSVLLDIQNHQLMYVDEYFFKKNIVTLCYKWTFNGQRKNIRWKKKSIF